jgi:hypothetical protein
VGAYSESYATDADVIELAHEDYGLLAAKALKVATGTDGVVPTDGFTITSVTNPDFTTRGVEAGMVLVVERANGVDLTDVLIVDSVATGTLTLRRIGLEAGQGDPPGGTSGLSGVRFSVRSLAAHLRTASRWVSGLLCVTEVAAVDDPTRYARLTALRVLVDRYRAAYMSLGTTDQSNAYLAKLKLYKQELAIELNRLLASDAILGRRAVAGEIGIGRHADDPTWITPPPY